MKILFFIDNLSAGGKERMCIELLKGLKGISDIHYELVIMNDNLHFKEVLGMGIRIHYLIRKSKKDLSIFKKVYGLCKEYKPDIIHSWDTMSAIYLIPTLTTLNIKFVNGTIRDVPTTRNILNKYWMRARITYPFSDLIVGNSWAGIKAYGAPLNKTVCIVNGFDYSRVQSLDSKEKIREETGITSKFVIGMVATFSVNKDYATYFAAAQMVLKNRNDITFLALGRNTDSKQCRELIDEKYLQNFRLIGNTNKVESFINIMDVCVLATYTEGVSNSILEYMALGKPVIATDGGGTSEIVQDKITGFLMQPKNVMELSDKIGMLLDDENLRINIGEAAKLRILNDFTIEKMVNEFIYNYRKLLS